jgi:type II secretory pathway pseudopilin PulG
MWLLRLLKIKNGMTLVEVMVSVFLIILLTGAVLALLVQNMRTGKGIDYNYIALNVAKSRIERIRELRRDQGFRYLYRASETKTRVDRNGTPDPEGDFTRTTKITTSFGGNPDLTQVQVTVSFLGVQTGYGIGETTLTLTTLMSPHI